MSNFKNVLNRLSETKESKDYKNGKKSAIETCKDKGIEWTEKFLQSKEEKMDKYGTEPNVKEYWAGYQAGINIYKEQENK